MAAANPTSALAVVEQDTETGVVDAIWRGLLARRFWARVDRSGGPDACWPWTGGRTRSDYGCFSRGRRGTHVRSHRFALELALGRPIRPGMGSCHTCDNPPCCNPAHLFEGTQRDNLQDASAKGRTALQRRPELARGERNSQAKLTTERVIDLRAAARHQPMRDVARQFGLSLSQTYRVASGDKWAHVPMEASND